MVDCEGPFEPADAQGNRYVLTYMCCLCSGVFLEPVATLTASSVRRAFSRCMFRSGTIPRMVRSDNGSEFANALLAEYVALIGLKHRFGTPFRPVEQGKVERVHQEKQQLLGIVLLDVLQAGQDHWSEALPVVEYLLYNTPGQFGFTPRDLDRRWSLAVPLEKDLRPFQIGEFENENRLKDNLSQIHHHISSDDKYMLVMPLGIVSVKGAALSWTL